MTDQELGFSIRANRYLKKKITFHRRQDKWRHKGAKSGWAHKRVDSWKQSVRYRRLMEKLKRKRTVKPSGVGRRELRKVAQQLAKAIDSFAVTIEYEDRSSERLTVDASSYKAALDRSINQKYSRIFYLSCDDFR